MKTKLASVVVLLLCCSVISSAQAKQKKAASEQKTIAQVLDKNLAGVEREFVSAADAMPEDKYDYAPTNGEFKGVRTFAEEVRHVAFVNHVVLAGLPGDKAPGETPGENGPPELKTKADIMKYLKDSFAYAHRAFGTITAKNAVAPLANPFGGKEPVTRLGMATLIVGHCFDHYGQMVEYLRSNGIVPPASRK